jgi:hypothetical protein
MESAVKAMWDNVDELLGKGVKVYSNSGVGEHR